MHLDLCLRMSLINMYMYKEIENQADTLYMYYEHTLYMYLINVLVHV